MDTRIHPHMLFFCSCLRIHAGYFFARLLNGFSPGKRAGTKQVYSVFILFQALQFQGKIQTR